MFPTYKWVGIDRTDFTRFYSPGDFFVHNVKDYLPFAANTFDLVWSHHVLEHLPPIHPYAQYSWYNGPEDYLVWLINEIWRVLKPGGEAHLVVPWNKHTNAWRSPGHYRFFDENFFAYFGWNGNVADHESCGLWSKWQVLRNEVVDNMHVYGILKSLEWASKEERNAMLGPFSKDWKAIDVPVELGHPLISAGETQNATVCIPDSTLVQSQEIPGTEFGKSMDEH